MKRADANVKRADMRTPEVKRADAGSEAPRTGNAAGSAREVVRQKVGNLTESNLIVERGFIILR